MSRPFVLLAALALVGCGSSGSSNDSTGGATGTAGKTSESGGKSGNPSNSGGRASSGGGGAPSNGAQPAEQAGAGSGVDPSGGAASPGDALGAYPFTPSAVTRGGTMTFQNVGAAGWWPRRLERAAGDAACSYKDGTDTWGGHCCMEEHATDSTKLAPFDEEMTLIMKAIDVKQLAVYQPQAGDDWQRVTDWDARSKTGNNLWFTQSGDGSRAFPGDLTKNDCTSYIAQAPLLSGADYYTPSDPGVMHRGFKGSKLIVFLASMSFDDAQVKACDGKGGAGAPGPWVAFVASELIRDGGRKWNGLCNCYSKTGSVGDGCGEINVFEVVMDNNDYSNREFASTGVRSFQAGHVGGAVCGSGCDRDAFASDVEVVDACAKRAYDAGPEIVVGGDTDGCPVWRRPDGDRYFFILLDEQERAIQVGVIHPSAIPQAAEALLPELPGNLPRTAIDSLLALRLPG
ncbi:MAG TPA: DUF2403 domain-containing lipoprotein [Polyangiaceae bacterium]|nr:DUF2403 domain-containing lipoprotein [Polyangiaceae bacterium]